MIGLLLAAFASMGWGASGTLAGRASRTLPALHVAMAVEWGALVVMAVTAGIVAAPAPDARHIGMAVLAGAFAALGNVLMYRALAIGSMGLVAPVAAAGAAVPVIVFGLATGDHPSTMSMTGAAITLMGIAAVARAPGIATRRGLGLAALSALAYGIYFDFLDVAADGGVVWATTISRAAAAMTLSIAVLVAGRRAGVFNSRLLLRVAAIGLLDAFATLSYAAAATHGFISLIAVIASLYPLTTAALAYVLFGERLGRWQLLGALVTMAGVSLVLLGT